MRRIVAGLLALCALSSLFAGCAAPDVPRDLIAPPMTAEIKASREFRLGPNDILRIRVYGHPELSTPASMKFDGTRVDPDGRLSLPLIGPIAVQGLTLAETRERVITAYSVYIKEPKLDLSVLEFAARRFYLYGEVNEPGAYAMDRPLNVYQALTFGSGFRPTADRRRIVLVREAAEQVEVYVVNGEELESSGLIDIQPDDFLFVMRSGTGRFREEALPILTGISSTLSSLATILLIEDRIKE